MTESEDPDAIRAEIDRTRAELSDNIDNLTDTANPKNIAGRQLDRVSGAARSVRDKIMGAPDDPYDEGRMGDARDAVSQVSDAVSDAPTTAKEQTRGNPLAAGLIAFGAGMLLSSLFPASKPEREAVSDLQDRIEPLKEQAGDMAQEIAQNLREPAREAAQSVRSTAADAAQEVKNEGISAKDRVQAQAHDSSENVRGEATR